MTSLVEKFQTKLDGGCLVEKIKKGRCGVSLANIPQNRLVVDLDKEESPLDINQKRCDYLVIAENCHNQGWVVPLEIKGGDPKLSHVCEQLQAVAVWTEAQVTSDMKFSFIPTVASGKLTKFAKSNLKSATVKFRGKDEKVRRIRCGGGLAEVL